MSIFPINAALEAAIIAHADEDTPRLAYADWLDENNDPDRAAFIRVQCRLAEMSPAEPDWVDLREQQDELVARLKSRFDELEPQKPGRMYFGRRFLSGYEEPFRRGFPYFVQLKNPADETQLTIAELKRLGLTTTIHAFEAGVIRPEQLAELLADPVAATLTGLSLTPDISPENWQVELTDFFRHLTTHSALRHLQQLFLYRRTLSVGIESLANATVFNSLRRLMIQEMDAPKTILEKLMAAPWIQRLRQFQSNLSDPEIALPMITGLGKLPELHTLELPGLASEAIPVLANGAFATLGRLYVNCPFDQDAIEALARAQFPALAMFEVSSGLSETHLLTVLQAKWFERLRVLALSDNAIDDNGLQAIAAHPVAKTLRVLRAGENAFGKAGLAALTKQDAFPALTTLDFASHNDRPISSADLAKWLRVVQLPRLRHLNLGGWPLGNAGAIALAANPTFANLTRLSLESCRIRDAGAKAIFASRHLQNLVELKLGFNAITSGADALTRPTVMPQLSACWLANNKLTETVRKIDRKGLVLIL